MNALLKPAYTLNLGSQQWTEQLLTLQVKLETAPLIDVLTATLPIRAPISASVGDPVELTLDSGEKQAKIFTGEIYAMYRTFTEIRVQAVNAGAKLALFRPAATYDQVTAGTVVTNLCGDVGVDTGDIADGVALAFYAADPSRTAMEHIARVCDWSGAIGRVSGENKVESVIVNATQPEVALKYGREILDARQWTLSSPIQSFVVAGESGAGDASSPDAFRPSTNFFGDNSPDGPSSTARWFADPALRTSTAASTAAAARKRRYDSSRESGRFDAFLQPDLRPGTVVQVQDLPQGLPAGPIWLYRVSHSLTATGASTRAWFHKGGDAFDPTSLLGSLAGAIGGLL